MIKFNDVIELTEDAAHFFIEAAAMTDGTMSEFDLFEIVLEEYAKKHLQEDKEGDLEPWNL